jgi:hypothetical protein
MIQPHQSSEPTRHIYVDTKVGRVAYENPKKKWFFAKKLAIWIQ